MGKKYCQIQRWLLTANGLQSGNLRLQKNSVNHLFPTVRSQLAAGFTVMVVLLLLVVVIASVNFDRLFQSQEVLYERAFQDVVQLQQLETNDYNSRLAVAMMLLEPEGADNRRRELSERVDRLDEENDQLLLELRARHPASTAIGQLLTDYALVHELFRATRDDEVIPAILENDRERAHAITVEGVQQERHIDMRGLTSRMLEMTREAAIELVAEAERRSLWSRNLLVGIGAGAIVVAILLAFYLSRLISAPLTSLADTAERIATGDLTMDIPETNRGDDIGKLSGAFRAMVHSLRQINQEISEGVNVLASTSSEILAATSQIATGVSETAASVNETTSTLDEARQTANVVSEKAQAVSDISQSAARVSREGRQEVEDAIHEMDVIREHMENIGRSIARLHEHSQAIGDIILTVNDLSEQSNLLAVNAAIEAAKAGENGRGFSVVAREMKNLAVQSKQATTQVRSILSDIQQNANSTVMATERGHKVVEAGVTRSQSAGEAIREMTESIASVAQAAMQIATSSSEQLVGMDQVATAMENITQASHQNAAGTKQAEESARALHELGSRLREVIDRYKL